MIHAPKQKICKVCKSSFSASRLMQSVCSPVCAISLSVSKRDKAAKVAQVKERRETKEKLDKLKSKAQWAREAQKAFNAWVRERDHGKPCISCGRHHQGQNHAGHYLSRGARPELRFEPLNVHLQCAPCNTHLSGNVALYRIELIKRVGLEAVEWLEGPHLIPKYTTEDLQAIKTKYTARAKELKKSRA